MISEASDRYSQPVFKKDQPDDSYKFLPLPEPTGAYPFHFSLSQVLPEISNEKLVFHMVGDTGSVRNPSFQKLVVKEMVKQFENKSVVDRPKFLYHLGDVVYNFGEADRYYEQFFSGYEKYPAPIFAIAGNHDSDVNPFGAPYKSLDPFKSVFCDTTSRDISFSRGSTRKSMTQPNIYWTPKTPLANIIGLHSNVPKYGIVTPKQQKWFKEELNTAKQERPGKALIVCIHHAPYSADINHGSSEPMISFLEGAFEETGVKPDIVFSGHVHNYQRFHKRYPEGKVVPFIVAGAGGYDELHPIAQKKDHRFTARHRVFEGIELINSCDDKHGFLLITVEKFTDGLKLKGEYYALPHLSKQSEEMKAVLFDSFSIDLK